MNIDEYCCDLHPALIEKLNNALRSRLSKVDSNEKEDLQQELFIKIYEKTESMDFNENPPSFWSFFK